MIVRACARSFPLFPPGYSFVVISISTCPYLSIGTLKTNIAPIVRWVYLFNFFYDHALIIALVMYGPTVPICDGLIFA